MTKDYYTNRVLEEFVVKNKEQRGDFFSFDSEDGWSVGCSKNVYNWVNPGNTVVRESKNGFTSGWLIKGTWVEHKTDSELEEEHRKMQEKSRQRIREYAEANRERWQEMEDSLPDWLKAHMTKVRENGGDDFDEASWGYNLMVAKLAGFYVEVGDAILGHNYFTLPEELEPEAVTEFAKKEGTTGAQHDMAIRMAKAHLEGTF